MKPGRLPLFRRYNHVRRWILTPRCKDPRKKARAVPLKPLPESCTPLVWLRTYIRFSRGENYGWLGEDSRIFQRTILSGVVAAELYDGTRHGSEKRSLDDLCRAHRFLGHFSVPSGDTWIETGVMLRRARRALGQLEFSRHFRDALIALETVQARATLVTENIRDFARWKSLLASSGRLLKLFDPS
jgi:predicted nucleic acid-binding protein